MPYAGAPEHIEKSVKTVLVELNGLSYDEAKTVLSLAERWPWNIRTYAFPSPYGAKCFTRKRPPGAAGVGR